MIEAGAKEVPEDKMIEAIYKAHEVNQEIIKFIDKIVEECGKPKHSYESCAVPEELFAAIKEIVPPAEMEVAVFSDDKQTREENIRQVTEKLKEAFADKEEWLAVLGEAVYQYQKKTVRKMILKDHKRLMVVPLLRSVLWQQRQILSREYMVLLCSHVDRHRSVPSQLWLLLQKHRSLTDLTNLKLQRDICITTISRPIL